MTQPKQEDFQKKLEGRIDDFKEKQDSYLMQEYAGKKDWELRFDKDFPAYTDRHIAVSGDGKTWSSNSPVNLYLIGNRERIKSFIATEKQKSYDSGLKDGHNIASAKFLNEIKTAEEIEEKAKQQAAQAERDRIINLINMWKNEGDSPTETGLVLENILAKLKSN